MHFKSNKNGRVQGTYDATQCKPESAAVEKQGYESYSSGLRTRYVLRRRVGASEISNAANLVGDRQMRELRALLAGDFGNDRREFADSVFYYEARFRPALRALTLDPLVTEGARFFLSSIGAPEDLRLMVKLAPPRSSLELSEVWRYALVTALVRPDNESEWAFLRRCALNDFDDRWADAGAIQTFETDGIAAKQEIAGGSAAEEPEARGGNR